MYRGLTPKLELKWTVERHLPTERDASPGSESVAPARGIDRHTEDRHPGDDDEKDGQRQADEGDERGDDATPRAHGASLITALACPCRRTRGLVDSANAALCRRTCLEPARMAEPSHPLSCRGTRVVPSGQRRSACRHSC